MAEAESVIVRVDARRGNALYINDGAFGTLFDAAYLGFRFPARLIGGREREAGGWSEFALYGPTCDSGDFMPGPFVLPNSVREGDYIEIGQVGAYGRVLSTGFNGFDEILRATVDDRPPVEEVGAVQPPLKAARAA